MNNYISTYALYHPNDVYLEHGLSWGKHRYIKRTGTPGNYKYFYAEDLRNAGRNLASGARNLVRRVGDTVGSFTGSTQKRRAAEARENYRKAQDATRVALRRMNTYSQRADRDLRNSYKDTNSPQYKNMVNRAQRIGGDLYNRYSRAADAENAARQRVNEAEADIRNAPLRKAIRAIKDLPFNISIEVEDRVRKVKEKIGIDYRSSIMKAKRNLENEARWSKPGSYAYDRALAQYNTVISNYGQTFVGNMERVFNTQFYKDILR